MNGKKLFLQIQKGNEEAFECYFRKHYDGLLKFVWGYVNSEAVAEELVQEVFLRIWKNREELDSDKPLSAYLFRTARNISIDYLRHSKVEESWAEEKKKLHNPTQRPTVDERLNDKMLLDEVKKAIQALPERRREVFMLSRYEGMSYKQIAQVLDISVSTVETHIRRSLRSLREQFEPYITFVSLLIAFLLFV